MKYIILLVTATTYCFSFAQTVIGNKKIITGISGNSSKYSVAYFDEELASAGKPAYFVQSKNTKAGPFDTTYMWHVTYGTYVEAQEKGTLQFIIAKKSGKYTVFVEDVQLGPFKESPHIVHVDAEKIVTYEYWDGYCYKIFDRNGNLKKPAFKSEKFEMPLDKAYFSGNASLVVTENPEENVRKRAWSNGKEIPGIYYEVHHLGWLNTPNGKVPLINCVEPAPADLPELDVLEIVYAGDRKIATLRAILYDFAFNADSTNFIIKGYGATGDFAHVYTADAILGPYDEINDLMWENNTISFEYKLNDEYFNYLNGVVTKVTDRKPVEFVVFNDDNSEKLEFYRGKLLDEEFSMYEQNIVLRGDTIIRVHEFGYEVLGWQGNEPEILYSDSGVVNLRTAFGKTITATRIIDYLPGDATNYACVIMKGEKEYMVYHGNNVYGPYPLIFHFGIDPEKILIRSEDGKNVHYCVVENGTFSYYTNGVRKEKYYFPSLLYYKDNFEHSLVTEVVKQESFLDDDFLIFTIDDNVTDSYYMGDPTYFIQKSNLAASKNGYVVHYKGQRYNGFAYVHEVNYDPAGKWISFSDIDAPWIILNEKLTQGKVMSNFYLIYEDGQLKEVKF